jgi:hypothetical protein
MKKSFFLPLIAALAVIFSFSACSDDKDDKEFVKVACNIEASSLGTQCWELSGFFPSSEVSENIAEAKAICLEDIEDFKGQISENFPDAVVNGNIATKCQDAELECLIYSIDGEELKYYYSGLLTMTHGGGCPSL